MEILDLQIEDFLALRRDAFIAEMNKSEKGKEYLKNASMFEQTEPDRAGLKKLLNEMGGA